MSVYRDERDSRIERLEIENEKLRGLVKGLQPEKTLVPLWIRWIAFLTTVPFVVLSFVFGALLYGMHRFGQSTSGGLFSVVQWALNTEERLSAEGGAAKEFAAGEADQIKAIEKIGSVAPTPAPGGGRLSLE